MERDNYEDPVAITVRSSHLLRAALTRSEDVIIAWRTTRGCDVRDDAQSGRRGWVQVLSTGYLMQAMGLVSLNFLPEIGRKSQASILSGVFYLLIPGFTIFFSWGFTSLSPGRVSLS
ncbi:hypothetical protein C8R43DRAFT_19930 [Mycena crocata]|nr:hypothetical protein C8R43DRAFT_19930 [Mycena crocata]